MNGTALQNLISKGWGTAARRTGQSFVVYRPASAAQPLDTRNRVIRLCANFSTASGAPAGVSGYESVLWRGLLDSLYTRAGDYLVGNGASFFVASQWQLQPVLCVKVGNEVSIERPALPANGDYSGFTTSDAETIINAWPACVVAVAARITGSLPESKFGNWVAYLPILPATPQIADVVTDDLGRRFVIAAANLTNLGWRLAMRQVDG